MRTLDAVILAGEKADAIPVLGDNKAFLDFRGKPMVAWVIDALDRSESISSITVVGPEERLRERLAGVKTQKPLKIFPQGDNIFHNLFYGGLSTFPEFKPGMTADQLRSLADAEKAVMVLTSDLPLLEPTEVDHFVRTAPLERADIVYGFSSREILEPFEAAPGRPGVTFMYFCFRETISRHSNTFIFRPLKLAPILSNFAVIVYHARYQRHFRNVLVLGREVLRYAFQRETLTQFLLLQAAKAAHRHGLYGLRDYLRRNLSIERVERNVSKVFQTRTAYHEAIGPGLTLDIDDEDNYKTLIAKADEWKKLQLELIGKSLPTAR